MGIDPDGDPVGDAVGVSVPPRQPLRDLRRLGVEHARAHVERVVVVEEADLGWLGGRLALVGVFLQEVLRGLGARPVGLVEPPVDGDLRGRAHGRDAGRRAGRRSGSRRRLPASRPRDGQERRNQQDIQGSSTHAASRHRGHTPRYAGWTRSGARLFASRSLRPRPTARGSDSVLDSSGFLSGRRSRPVKGARHLFWNGA